MNQLLPSLDADGRELFKSGRLEALLRFEGLRVINRILDLVIVGEGGRAGRIVTSRLPPTPLRHVDVVELLLGCSLLEVASSSGGSCGLTLVMSYDALHWIVEACRIGWVDERLVWLLDLLLDLLV